MDLKPGARYKLKRQRLPHPGRDESHPRGVLVRASSLPKAGGIRVPRREGFRQLRIPSPAVKLRESCGSASFSSFGCRPPPGFTSPFVPQQSLSPLYGANYSAMSLTRAPFTKRMMAERAGLGRCRRRRVSRTALRDGRCGGSDDRVAYCGRTVPKVNCTVQALR